MMTPIATDYSVAVLCEDKLFHVASVCDTAATNCSRLASLRSSGASDEVNDDVQCVESHRIAVRFEQPNAIVHVGCEQLFAVDCARLAAHGPVTLACNQLLYTMYEGGLIRGTVIRHETNEDAVLLGVTLRTGQVVQIVRRLEECRFGTEVLMGVCDAQRETASDDTSSDCSMKQAGTDGLIVSESAEVAGRLTATRRDAPIAPRRKTVSESNTNEVMDDQTAAIVLTSLSASANAAARHCALSVQRAVPAPGQPIDAGGHVAGPLKRGVRQRCSNSLSEPYSASALRSRLAAAASQAQVQAQGSAPEREREREAPLVRYPHHFGATPAFLLVAQQRNEQAARVPLRLTPAPTESGDIAASASYRGALFQPAIVQAVPIFGTSAAAASISSSAPSTLGSTVPLQRPSVPFSATPRQPPSFSAFPPSVRPVIGSGSSSPREPSMPPCAPGANVSVVSRDEGIGADIEMDDSSCTTASASTSTIGASSTTQATVIPYRFECTWRGCTMRTTTRHAIEQHIRDAHLSEEERGKNEEEFYYNEIDEHDDDDCTSESLAADGDGSAERRRGRTADDLIDSVAAGFSSLIASSPPTTGAAVRPPPANAASHSPFIGASANGPLVLPAALVAAPRNGTPRAPNANALGTSLSTMANGPVKVLRSAPVSILSVTPSAVLTPPGGATPSSWSTSTAGVAAPLRFMNFYSYQLVPATPSSSWSPHSDRVQPGCAPANFTLATGRPPNGSPQNAVPTNATTTANTTTAAAAAATPAPAPASDYDSEQAGDDAAGGSASRRSKSDVKKCRKVYGIENRDKWCLQCKWKKACTRFPD